MPLDSSLPANRSAISRRANAVLKKAGLEIACKIPYSSWEPWTHGVRVEAAMVISPRHEPIAAAIGVLRAAGWTVDDDGMIAALPAVDRG